MTIIDGPRPHTTEPGDGVTVGPGDTPVLRPTDVEASAVLRWVLAGASAGAGAVHLAMVPDHAAEWMPEGLAFAATGWLQVGFAALVVARPTRLLLRVAVVANLVFVAAWAVTRTAGMPVGPGAGVRSTASFVDVAAVLLEAVVVVGAALVLLRPGIGGRLGAPARAAFAAIPIGALVLATAAIASPSAANHDHGTGGETAAGGHAHGAPAGDHGDDHGAAPADDRGYSKLMNGAGEGGGHAHEHAAKAKAPLSAGDRAKLDAELATTQTLVAKYPTIRAAEADGYHRQGPYSPGLGVHYSRKVPSLNPDGRMDPEDMAGPMLIFDGTEPGSKLAGFMYLASSPEPGGTPEGFTGDEDEWHFHTNVCVTTRPDGTVDTPLGADTSAPKDLCDRYGGRLIERTPHMLHVWTVPGYESPEGVFSNLSRRLQCPDGSYHTVAMEEIGNRINLCRDVPAG